MGEVYRGRDTRLGRDVALKVISPKRVGDADLRRRFELEARAASVLNHPSIVTIYDVGETNGVSWIAMEWVEGRTLREVLADGPLPMRDVLTIGRQIAEGLCAAHERGIVHRDLKPENVMVGRDGRTRILDFGLARQTFAGALSGGSSAIETLATPAAVTGEGVILGTVGYMSPEQASGLPADARSDQFALGLIVYEMVAGRRAFARATAVETLTAIIKEEPPPLSTVRLDVPPALESVIAHCLAKRPEKRFESTREVAAALGTDATGSAPISFSPTLAVVDAPPLERRRLPLRRAVVVIGAVALLAGGVAAYRARAAKGAIRSLAILPFENASKDPEVEYLGDGLTDNLINQMSRVASLKVMARATVFRFKGSLDPQDAGKKLGVGAVLTGTVLRRGDRLSISVELVEVPTGARLWGEKYDRPSSDLIRTQDDIAADISDGLRLRLSGAEKSVLGRHGTENSEAYDLALKARYFVLKDTEEGYLEGRRLYLLAAEKDPAFAEAWLGVSNTYGVMAVNGLLAPAEAWARSDEGARKTLDLDPGNVGARCALVTRRFFFDWDWAGTEHEFRELGADPRVIRGEGLRPIGLSLWARGRADEAFVLMERAMRLDPGNVAAMIATGDYLAQAGKLAEAADAYGAAMKAEPSDSRPLFGLSDVLLRRRDVTGAIDALRRAYELDGEDEGVRLLASARTENDLDTAKIGVARSRLAEVEEMSRKRYVSPLDVARLNAQAGEREKAFASLEAAFKERSPGLVLLRVDRAWDRIREDPRFTDLVRRVGIP